MKTILPTTNQSIKEALSTSKSAFQSLIYMYTARCTGVDQSSIIYWLNQRTELKRFIFEQEVSDIHCLNCILENIETHYSTEYERSLLIQEIDDLLEFARTSASVKTMFLLGFKKALRAA